jgi:hypothetical protein
LVKLQEENRQLKESKEQLNAQIDGLLGNVTRLGEENRHLVKVAGGQISKDAVEFMLGIFFEHLDNT